MKIYFSFLVLLFFVFQKANAQDTIIKINGDKVIAKVMEVNETEIKYKLFDFLDGPLYVAARAEVKIIKYGKGIKETVSEGKNNEPPVIQLIKSPNEIREGSTLLSPKIDDFQVSFSYKNEMINEFQMQTILVHTRDSEIIAMVQKSQQAKRREKIGYATIPFAIGATVAALYFKKYSENNNIKNTRSDYTNSELNKYKNIAGICLIGTIICPVTSGVLSHKRKGYNSEAIRLYNQKY